MATRLCFTSRNEKRKRHRGGLYPSRAHKVPPPTRTPSRRLTLSALPAPSLSTGLPPPPAPARPCSSPSSPSSSWYPAGAYSATRALPSVLLLVVPSSNSRLVPSPDAPPARSPSRESDSRGCSSGALRAWCACGWPSGDEAAGSEAKARRRRTGMRTATTTEAGARAQ
ncbi:hypothetical protein DMC30DRAFT_95996 [Rhodotorula diobovata]|uniref:Uncharacterized protein n=1 Tax=Rhodotorula diobovata TaxID=5288 RepID=A0A5C5FNE1_9BASI|nr:hypothetical protein DMC30DRAFT_95996 [Rhodotorula diobovata]